MSKTTTNVGSGSLGWLLGAGALLAAELLLISLLYQHNFEFTCRAAAPAAFCAFAGRMVPRALAVFGALILFALARPQVSRTLWNSAPPALRTALTVNLIGLALVLAPWPLLSDAASTFGVTLAAASWMIGGLLTALGLALFVAPFATWLEVLRTHANILVPLVLAALAMPEIANLVQPLWQIEAVTEATFVAVVWVIGMLGYTVTTYPSEKIIGADEFLVAVGPQCSGVEGFALVSIFLLIYILLFRRDLAFPNVLLLFPIGIALSWAFNVLRISALLSLGAEVSAELAIGGFHSHAGWLAFTALSVALILISRTVPFFANTTNPSAPAAKRPAIPFFQDPAVAEVLPFIVFMLSALLASTFLLDPGQAYPYRAAAWAITLALFLPYLRSLPWRIDLLSVLTGLLIAAGWIVTGPPAPETPVYGALAGGAFVFWVAVRVIGTSILVPVIEELVFRSYLLRRIAPSGTGWRMALGIVISAGLFALLHDRWAEAALAGLIFGALVWRSRNITDAIVSHATANAAIALWAIVTGAWHII